MRIRLQWPPWTSSRAFSTGRVRGGPSCFVRCSLRPGRCGSRTKRRSPWWPSFVITPGAFDDGESTRLEPGETASSAAPSLTSSPATPPPIPRSSSTPAGTAPTSMATARPTLCRSAYGRGVTAPSVLGDADRHLSDRRRGQRPAPGALPRLAVVPVDGDPLIALLGSEIQRDEQGQQGVLDRLLDLILVTSLRCGSPVPTVTPRPGSAPTTTRSSAPRCACAPRPAHPWSVSSLALPSERHGRCWPGDSMTWSASRLSPISRSGEWRWRPTCFASRRASVGGVAAAVGYTSPFTFSAAFKRIYGTSPSAHRASHALADNVA